MEIVLLHSITTGNCKASEPSPFSPGKSIVDEGFIRRTEMTVNIQYVGFQVQGQSSENTASSCGIIIEPREITFTILNEAFRAHGLRYQDAPTLLTEAASRDGQLRGRSTENTLSDQRNGIGINYRDSHSPKTTNALYPRKNCPGPLASKSRQSINCRIEKLAAYSTAKATARARTALLRSRGGRTECCVGRYCCQPPPSA